MLTLKGDDNAKPWKIYAVATHAFAFVLIGTLITLFETASGPTFRGIAMWFVSGLGWAFVPLALGLLGFAYKPNRLGGYVIASWLALAFMFLGLR